MKQKLNILKEWAQGVDDIEKVPKEIKDLKLATKYNVYCALTREMPVPVALQGIDMAIEAAFNLGKANATKE